MLIVKRIVACMLYVRPGLVQYTALSQEFPSLLPSYQVV
jgi:hypothetical protein